MRISDWSSDVCSSDLASQIEDLRTRLAALGSGAETTATKVRTFADVLADLNEKSLANAAKEYAGAIDLIERTIESGLTDQQRYERQVGDINRALELAAERGWKLSAENAERLNRALREADPDRKSTRLNSRH